MKKTVKTNKKADTAKTAKKSASKKKAATTPKKPRKETIKLPLKANLSRSQLEQVSHAARERGRYALENLYVGPEGSVATDGRRLALVLPPEEDKGHLKDGEPRLSRTEEAFMVPKALIARAKKLMEPASSKKVYAQFRDRRMDVVDMTADPRQTGSVGAKVKTREGDIDFKFEYPMGEYPSWQSVIADYFPDGVFPENSRHFGFDPDYVIQAMKLLQQVAKDRGNGYEASSIRMDVINKDSPVFFWNRFAVVLIMPIDITTEGDDAVFANDKFPFFASGMGMKAIKAESDRKKAEAEKKRKEEAAKREADLKAKNDAEANK